MSAGLIWHGASVSHDIRKCLNSVHCKSRSCDPLQRVNLDCQILPYCDEGICVAKRCRHTLCGVVTCSKPNQDTQLEFNHALVEKEIRVLYIASLIVTAVKSTFPCRDSVLEIQYSESCNFFFCIVEATTLKPLFSPYGNFRAMFTWFEQHNAGSFLRDVPMLKWIVSLPELVLIPPPSNWK